MGAGISIFTGRSILLAGTRMIGIGVLAASTTFGIGKLIGVSAS